MPRAPSKLFMYVQYLSCCQEVLWEQLQKLGYANIMNVLLLWKEPESFSLPWLFVFQWAVKSCNFFVTYWIIIETILNETQVQSTWHINPFMQNVVKWPNVLQKSCGIHTARFLKNVWPFYHIMHERVNVVTWKMKFTELYQFRKRS